MIEPLIKHPAFNLLSIHEAIMAARTYQHTNIAQQLSLLLPVDSKGADGNTMLLREIDAGEAEAVQVLLTRGANPDLEGRLGIPLLLAINRIQYTPDGSPREEPSEVHVQIARQLITKGANKQVEDIWSKTPAQAAVKLVCPQIFEMLSQDSLPPPVKEKRYDSLTRTQIVYELPWYSHLLLESYMFAIKQNPGTKRRADWFALMKMMKDKNVNFTVTGRSGQCLLAQVMRDLIESTKLEPQGRITSGIPETNLFHHPQHHRAIVMEQEKEAATNCLRSQNNFMLQLDVMTFLLELGVDLSVHDEISKNTLLHDFALYSSIEHLPDACARVMDSWIERCFPIEVKTTQGMTLLHAAASVGNIPVVQYLLARGADVNAQDLAGNTPLHLARNVKVVDLLCKHNANAKLTNVNGNTPSQLCTNAINNLKKQYSGNAYMNMLSAEQSILAKIDRYIQHGTASADNHLKTVLRGENACDATPVLSCFSDAYTIKHFPGVIRMYQDSEGQLMRRPVYLRGRLYDFETLKSRCDSEHYGKEPATGQPFNLSEITWADDVMYQMHDLVGHINRLKAEAIHRDEKVNAIQRQNSSFG